ncbi:SLBB domain-containing protein [Methyloceanibacter sp.]|uniref:SLBB domain-containing protein n=1 Tax=Methyloceanibacter sp. TaxID=1965321 RepID=UPI003C76799A
MLGDVTTPGQYPFANGLTVENAVAIAEGYTSRAKKRFVRLTRGFDGVKSTVMVPTGLPRPARRYYLRPPTPVLKLKGNQHSSLWRCGPRELEFPNSALSARPGWGSVSPCP